MAETQSKEFIQQWVHDRLHEIREVNSDRSLIKIPMPQWHEPDADGCNWDMGVFGGDASDHIDGIRRIVGEARRKFRIPNHEK